MAYDVVISYTPKVAGSWEDVRVSLIRPKDEMPESCHNQDSFREREHQITLSDRHSQKIALDNVCLEEGKIYKFIVSFQRQNQQEPTPSAQILIDSVSVA